MRASSCESPGKRSWCSRFMSRKRAWPAVSLCGVMWRAGGGGARLDGLARIEALPGPALEFRLVIEGVDLADAAIHEELNDAPRLGPMMQSAVEIGRGLVGKQSLACEQVRQRDAAQAA